MNRALRALPLVCVFLALAVPPLTVALAPQLMPPLDGLANPDPMWEELSNGSVEFSHALEEAEPKDRPAILKKRTDRARSIYARYGVTVPTPTGP